MSGVLFLAGNDYIYARSFCAVMERLAARGVVSRLLCLYRYGPDGSGCVPDRLPFPGPSRSACAAWAKAEGFAHLAADRFFMDRFLRRTRPAALVVGGDVGDPFQGLLIDLCRGRGIPVVILAVTRSAPWIGSGGRRRMRLAKSILGPLGLLRCAKRASLFRVLTHDGWEIGSFAAGAIVCVPDREEAAKLMENGIAQERIRVTGLPSHDEIERFRIADKHLLKQQNGMSAAGTPDARVVLYCTEGIQDVHGMPYLLDISRVLKRSFDNLPDDCRVAVRFHPRETDEGRAVARRVFAGDRYLFPGAGGVVPVLRAADLVLCHFSTILPLAALLGTPVLSVRVRDDQTPIFLGTMYETVHALTPEEIGPKMLRLLEDPDFVARQCGVIQRWRERAGIVLDGRRTDGIADVITEAIGPRKNKGNGDMVR